MDGFDPRDHLNRNLEQDQFQKMITLSTTARMLTICDDGARGKSSLLARLRHNCVEEPMGHERIPACIVDLDKLSEHSAFEVVHRIYNDSGLGVQIDACSMRDRFVRYKTHIHALGWDKVAFFDQDTGSSFRQFAEVTVEGNVDSGAQVGGVIAKNAHFYEAEKEKLTPEQRQIARSECVEAFFEDLSQVCSQYPIVIMFDTWERCNAQVRDWIRSEFLRNRWRHADPQRRPEKLIIVVAGRPHKPSAAPHGKYGLRPDEFKTLFNDPAEYASTVWQVPLLSHLEVEHVRQFLEQHGIVDVPDEDVLFAQRKLQQGISLVQIRDGMKHFV